MLAISALRDVKVKVNENEMQFARVSSQYATRKYCALRHLGQRPVRGLPGIDQTESATANPGRATMITVDSQEISVTSGKYKHSWLPRAIICSDAIAPYVY